ncbi:hypothetical protein HPB49_008527 [Dermacentor silvarum]|uniref:Uncharacterized protein n=1 Tax=Dermacentor silvarum TaxID=543639 RepID=A0ACB8DBW5_DERSI|nr:hypothetical protein HPB49_008527 [Dermacentor silvarum]
MTSRKFCLKWKRNQLSEVGVPVQLHIDEAKQDVALLCDGMCLTAHKTVLAAFSPFFHELFAANPGSDTVVIPHGVRYADLTMVVEFIYRGEVIVPHQQLYSLAKAASTFKVEGRFMFARNDGTNQVPLSTNVGYSAFPCMTYYGRQMPPVVQQALRSEFQITTGKVNASIDQTGAVASESAENAQDITLALDALRDFPVASTARETTPATAPPSCVAPSDDSVDFLTTGPKLPATVYQVTESVNHSAKGGEACHFDTGLKILDTATVKVSMPTEALTPVNESRLSDGELSTFDGTRVVPVKASLISACSEHEEAAGKPSLSNISDMEQPLTKLPSPSLVTDNKTVMNNGCASGAAVSSVECSSKVLMPQENISSAPVITDMCNHDSVQQEPTSAPGRPSSPSSGEGSSSGSEKTCAECPEDVTPLSSTGQLSSPKAKKRKYRSLSTGNEPLTSIDEQTAETSWSGPITRSRAARLAKQLK